MSLSYKNNMADAFGRSAHTYDQAALVQQESGRELLALLQSYLAVPDDMAAIEQVADIGCGTGYFTQALMETCGANQAVGVDLSQGMLDVASTKYANDPRLQWLCADAEDLSLPEASFDIIYANFSLQWCEDLPRLMNCFYRVLKPGGICCFNTLGRETLYELRESWSQADQLTHVNQFTHQNQWREAIEPYFSILQYRESRHVMFYDTVKQLLLSLKNIGANTVTGEHRQTALMGKQRFAQFAQAYESYRSDQGLPASYDVNDWLLKKR